MSSEEEDLVVCDVCGDDATFRCSACKVALYCSPECQQIAWKGNDIIEPHSEECSELTELIAMEAAAHIVGPRRYTEQQRKLIYAHGGHLTPKGHARGPRGTKFKWPSKAHVRAYKSGRRK